MSSVGAHRQAADRHTYSSSQPHRLGPKWLALNHSTPGWPILRHSTSKYVVNAYEGCSHYLS